MSHYAEYRVVFLADGADALCRHNGHCVAPFPPSFDSPERSGYRRSKTAMPSLRSARSCLTRGLQLVSPRPRPGTCTDNLFPVASIPSTPHLVARSSRRPPTKGPSPRLPARLAPRFRSLRVARGAHAQRQEPAAPLRRSVSNLFATLTNFAGLAPASGGFATALRCRPPHDQRRFPNHPTFHRSSPQNLYARF
jgi:hypothetical protein